MSQSRPIALTIAGSDSSGGAGIQADLKTFSMFGVYGASVVTALTAQNTVAVTGVLPTPAEFVTAQIDAVCSDLGVGAVKTGMLASAAVVRAVVDGIDRFRLQPVVVDPVMVATSGADLIDAAATTALRERLIPRAALVTPNLPEAARLLDEPIAETVAQMEAQGRIIQSRFGAGAVLVKGGHGSGAEAVDVLVPGYGMAALLLPLPRVETTATHGTGCTLSAAIAALLACGLSLEDAVRQSKRFVWQALSSGNALGLGHGHGPVDQLFALKPLGRK